MTATAVKLSLLLIVMHLALAVFFPQFRGALLALGTLILLWVSVVYFQTRMHLKRYLREECNGP